MRLPIAAAALALCVSPVPAHAWLKAGPAGYGHWLQSAPVVDTMATSLAGAYSFRKVRSAYAGPAVKLRRVDTTTQDVGFTAGGDFDKGTATAFCTTACTVQIWYDQSGNARHADRTANPPNQPAYVANCLGTQPCVQVTSSTYSLGTVANYTPVMPVSFNAVAIRNLGTGTCQLGVQYAANNDLQSHVANAWAVAGGGGGFISAAAADNAWHTGIGVIAGAASVLRIDGNETTGTVTGSLAVGAFLPISGFDAGTTCSATEVIYWSGYALSAAERTALAQNQQQYWTPLPLDSFATPAAAYSLRRLKSSYAGPAIRLRRASDNAELDIGFLGFTGFTGAPIDTAAANAHCAATTCSVVNWYDQSGSGRDGTQATPANQPAIVFGCMSGLPCMQVVNGSQLLAAAGAYTPTLPVTFGAVANHVSGTSNECYVGREFNSNYMTAANGNWVASADGLGAYLVGPAANGWHAGVATVNGAASVIRIDATETTGSIAGNTVSAQWLPVMGNTGQVCNVAEVVQWRGYALTATERAALQQNQKSFWGTP